ncbi:MAG: hypothetical protein LC768_04030 [Acidobacteria bacterium]|nr:hypothetical protein [Acidobacteriota bacterium]MCA1637493.1 hypothetical protein [Acidobacteriota bacterium]
MLESEELQAEVFNLNRHRNLIIAERESIFFEVEETRKAVVAGHADIQSLTEKQNVLQSFDAAIIDVELLIENLQRQHDEVYQVEARVPFLENILELDREAEALAEELEYYVFEFEEIVRQFARKRHELLTQIIEKQSDFNAECEKIIPNLRKSNYAYVLGLVEEKENLLSELRARGARLEVLQSGEQLEHHQPMNAATSKRFRTLPVVDFLAKR